MHILWLALIVVVVGFTSWLGWDSAYSGRVTFWCIVGGPTVALAAIGVWRAKRDDELFDWLRPKWGDFSLGFLGGIGVFACAYAFSRFVTAPGSWRRIWLVSLYSQLGEPSTLQQHAILVGVAILVAATAEELLWRGLVTTLLAERFGSRTAWVWAAILYSLAHVPSMWPLRSVGGALNPILPIAALGAGLVWGWMARSLGRLTPGILAHALFDWAIVMMFPLWAPRGA